MYNNLCIRKTGFVWFFFFFFSLFSTKSLQSSLPYLIFIKAGCVIQHINRKNIFLYFCENTAGLNFFFFLVFNGAVEVVGKALLVYICAVHGHVRACVFCIFQEMDFCLEQCSPFLECPE